VSNPDRKLGKADLMRLDPEDILQSRVFDMDDTKRSQVNEPAWET
jgi:hypothetical protein